MNKSALTRLIFGLLLLAVSSAYAQEETGDNPPTKTGEETAVENAAKPKSDVSEAEAKKQAETTNSPEQTESGTSEEREPKPKSDEVSADDESTPELSVDRFGDTPELSDFRTEVRAFEVEYAEIRKDIKRLIEYQRERRLSDVEDQFKRVIEDLSAR